MLLLGFSAPEKNNMKSVHSHSTIFSSKKYWIRSTIKNLIKPKLHFMSIWSPVQKQNSPDVRDCLQLSMPNLQPHSDKQFLMQTDSKKI